MVILCVKVLMRNAAIISLFFKKKNNHFFVSVTSLLVIKHCAIHIKNLLGFFSLTEFFFVQILIVHIKASYPSIC